MADDPTPQQRLDTLQSRYRFRFAGHARVSRDPELIRSMLSELDDLAQADHEPELATRIAEARELYEKELQAILEARAVPGAVPAHRARLWADLVIGRYARSFAGKPRGTRDVALLEEIRGLLRSYRDELQSMQEAGPHLSLGQALSDISGTLSLATREAERIREARMEGTHADQGTRLATLANDQFALYQEGFAGQSRLSRHPPRLERIVKSLEEIAAGMTRLQRDGFNSENNDRNLSLVTERTVAYKQEVTTMAETRAGVSSADRVNALGAAANRVFESYRSGFAGKNRLTVDPDVLNALFERLFAIAREMDRIDDEDIDDDPADTNERNLALVLDQLTMYAREWNEIRKARTADQSDA